MKVLLMNQYTQVLLAELENNNTFSKIYEYYNMDFAPLKIFNAYNGSDDVIKAFNNWFKGRGIPSWRQNLEKLLERLNVSYKEELLDKAYGLSLSDQYWLKDVEQELNWEDINFFENDFEYQDYLEASINYDSNLSSKISLYSPNNTTDGMVRKGWMINKSNERVLVKGTYSLAHLEPINEWLATEICKHFNISCCEYSLDIMDNQLVCKCPNFLTKDEEIISACDILELEKKDNNTSEYEHYINILESRGILDARKNMSDMYLVDFLLMNTDRHMKNYGVIRNVKTLKWVRTTPIFDTGNSLQSDVPIFNVTSTDAPYKFFTSRTMTLNGLIKYIDLKAYDLTNIEKLVNKLIWVLDEYREVIDLSDTRYNSIIECFKERIELLKENAKNSN